jgi:hypothetical protein
VIRVRRAVSGAGAFVIIFKGEIPMHPTDTIEREEQQSRWHAWRIARWLITAAASLVLVTLFLTQGASTEAAAPVPNSDVVYHEMAATPTCQPGYNCVIQNCLSGNYYFCGYNLGYTYPYNFGYGCGFGGLNCGINYGVNYIAPAYNNFPFYNGFYNRFFNGLPASVFVNNGCPVGNFSCLGTFPVRGCPAGNFSCLRTFFGYPFFSTGVFLATEQTLSVKEVAQPAAVTAPAAATDPDDHKG